MTKKQTEKKEVKKTLKQQREEKKAKELEKAKKLVASSGLVIASSTDVVVDSTVQDFRTAVIILSVAINLVVFLTWLILQYTTRYDSALVQAFLPR